MSNTSTILVDRRPDAEIGPLPEGECLFIGIDIGKAKHWGGFVSSSLLVQFKRYTSCPTLSFENSRSGFTSLLDHVRALVPLSRASFLMEHTGHYYKALEQFLLEQGADVYRMHVKARPNRLIKSDKRDSLALALHLYNQLEKHAQVSETTLDIRPVFPLSDTITRLQALARHHAKLSQEATQRKNRLIAICDELFPEFTQVWKNPNRPMPLVYRESFPTPAAIALASLEELRIPRGNHRSPSDARLLQLQALARESIGTKDAGRCAGLVTVQRQLIRELRLIEQHIQDLESEISAIVEQERAGQILMSLGVVGPIQAGTLLAAIGDIRNFETPAKLRAYLGWAPKREQTGTSLDSSSLARSGKSDLRATIYLIALRAVRQESEWKVLYTRLVARKCAWDAEKGDYTGKLKVLARIAASFITLVWVLLSRDELYDRAIHHQAREARHAPL